MKKNLLFGVVAAAVLMGCSDTSDFQVEKPLEQEMIVEEEFYSNVPFNFSAAENTAITRGVTATGYDNVGLFCLAKRPINDGITEQMKPSWSGKSKALINQHSVWKKNVPVGIQYTNGNHVKLVWDNPMNKDYYPYYPKKDWFAYGFVAYHPRTENLLYTQTTITAFIKLDGRDKVFYSMSKAPKMVLSNETLNQLSFSKSFYQALDPEGTGEYPEPGTEEYVYPYFHFDVLTSTLNFYFWSKGEPINNLHIEKVEFDDFPCIMMLGLAKMLRYADKTAYDMKSSISSKPFILNQDKFDERELSQFEELKDGPFGHFELYEENGAPIAGQKNSDGSYKYTLSSEKIKVGGSLYIPPVYSGHSREALNIYITVADDAGNKYKCTTPVVVKTKTGWKKNTSYDIPIWLNNPSEVAKDASLAEWEAAEPIEVNATNLQWVEQP